MSGESSSAAGWFSLLEPAAPPGDVPRRPDDPRLGEIVEFWNGDRAALRAGRAVIVGFPQDEGVRRNGGRVGAAEAPREIRRWLYRLTPWHPIWEEIDLAGEPPLDVGDIRCTANLEGSQESLGKVVGELLKQRTIPIVLGGGHETAYGHYLGYVGAGRSVQVCNIDAHLDVRPLIDGKGHSGSPFRQMLEHPTQPLPGPKYICLGAQPGCVSRTHWLWARQRGSKVFWRYETPFVAEWLGEFFKAPEQQVYLTIDADAFQQSAVPGVSAPNSQGLDAHDAYETAHRAGGSPAVTSLDVVEINPRLDRDGQSARWAAVVVWNFLIGLASRRQLESAR